MTETELYQYLLADTGITAITDRVFNGMKPENEPFPVVTLDYVSDNPENTLSGDSGHARSRYTVNAWASTYAEAQALKDAITSAMGANVRLSTVPLHEPKTNIYRFAIDYSVFS